LLGEEEVTKTVMQAKQDFAKRVRSAGLEDFHGRDEGRAESSSEGVVTCSTGLSNLPMVLIDSPSFWRQRLEAESKAFNTPSLLEACAFSRASSHPSHIPSQSRRPQTGCQV
jgi:hypothetical protein